MDKEILYEILNSESERLTSAQIESIMNEELDKSPQEMDTHLVDLCLDALENVDVKELNKTKRKIRLTKVLLAAAIFVLAVGIAIPACAKFLSINVPDGVVSIYKHCFDVDISNDEYIDNISVRLEQDGITDFWLPKIIFNRDTKISSYVIDNSTDIKNVEFKFHNDDLNGAVIIQQCKDDYDFIADKQDTNLNFDKIEYFYINEVKVMVFSKDSDSFISYVVDDIRYNINIECDYETACQIAKTL